MRTSRRGFLGAAVRTAATITTTITATSVTTGAARAQARPRGGGGRLAGPDRPVTATLTPFADALPVPPVLRPGGGEVTVEMRSVRRRLHSQLPPTRLWTYEGHFPGPTIEVRRGQRVRIVWVNGIGDERVPVTAVQVATGALDRPGSGDAVARADVAAIPAWPVVHLHGAVTGAGNDGWSENGLRAGETQIVEYANNQPAAALFYHDHGMHVSTWTVFSGLFGSYLIRDSEEDALGLPRGAHEIPLVLCDRNLETDPSGLLTGRLLHKVAITRVSPRVVTRPFEGPYTLVNGVIWPYLDVRPRWYRFRVLNASNGRTFRLRLIDETTGQPVIGVVKQIGVDSGLLPAPVDVDGPLVLAPAERADLLVDFRALGGRRVRLVNTSPDAAPGQTSRDVAFPEVMQFRVAAGRPKESFTPPAVTSPGFVRIRQDHLPAGHPHRVVLTMSGGSYHTQMWEMVEDPSAKPGTEGVVRIGKTVYRRVARMPDEGVHFFAELGGWEVWTFLNVARFMHPMHIHLMRFQILSRDIYDISGFDVATGIARKPLTRKGPGVIDPGEKGWKDVVRVDTAEMVKVAGRFTGGTGRYAYHCHLLEHQDEGMMRPFVVFPPAVLALRGLHDRQDGRR